MSLLTITRSSFQARYIPSTRRSVVASFHHWDHFLFRLSLDQEGRVPWTDGSKDYKENFKKFNPIPFEAQIFTELRKDENKLKRYVLLDQMAQSFAVNHDTGKKIDVSTAKMVYFNYVKAWLRYNEIELDQYKLKEVKWPKKIKERRQGIDRKMITDVIALCDDMHKGLYYIASYSAMRMSEIYAMEWSWIDLTESPLKITIPARITKTRQERITFVGGEAESWLKKHQGHSGLVFKSRDGQQLRPNKVWNYFSIRRKQCGFEAKKENGRHHFVQHSLRGYAENKMARGSGGSEFAHTMLGHGEYMITYNEAGKTDEDARNDYVSAMPFLTLDESQALREKNQKLVEKLDSAEDQAKNADLLKAFIQSNPEFMAKFKEWIG